MSGGEVNCELWRNEPVSDPVSLYRLGDGLMAVDLLAAAVHLDLFTWLGEHPATLGAICAHHGLKTRPVEVLLTLCTALGLTTVAGGVYHLTLRAREHLTEGSEYSLVPYYRTLGKRLQTLEFLEVLRSGKPANGTSGHGAAWAEAKTDEAFVEEFTAAMDCQGILLGPALARVLPLEETTRLLDVGGGSGIYSCALASRFPNLRASVFEKPPVDRIATREVDRRGFARRVSVIAGDLFAEEWPTGFDAVLISNVLHDWEEAEVRGILKRAVRALPPGGLLAIHDAFLNADKSGPLAVAQYSALLMHSTFGRCYSVGEIRGWLEGLGVDWVGHMPTAADRSCVLARRG